MYLGITGGVIISETENMRSSLFAVMGPIGQFLNFIVIITLAIWGLMSLAGIVRRSKNISVILRSGPDEWPGMARQLARTTRQIMPKSMIRKGDGGALRSTAIKSSGKALKDTSKKI